MNKKITPGTFYLIDGILYVVIGGSTKNKYHLLNLSKCIIACTTECSSELTLKNFIDEPDFPHGLLVERGKAKVLHPTSSSKIIEDIIRPKTVLITKNKHSGLKEYFLVIKLDIGIALLSMNTWYIYFDIVTDVVGITVKSLMKTLDILDYHDVFLARKNVYFMRHI